MTTTTNNTIITSNSGDTKRQGILSATNTPTPLVHEWGEHEIDYMMFLRMKESSPVLNLNPEEVRTLHAFITREPELILHSFYGGHLILPTFNPILTIIDLFLHSAIRCVMSVMYHYLNYKK